MSLNYINIVTNDSVWVINRISNLLRKKNYSIHAFSAAFDEKWQWHILVWIELSQWESVEQIISQVYRLFDVVSVEDMNESSEKVEYVFNVNCNCKKTLKKISRKPDRIIETSKELIYVFHIPRGERDMFLAELANLKLPYVSRVLGLTQ